ncbi:hypothetical protein HK096_002245, partial [Nowakowskiella sp. JEL0078]
MHSEKRPKVSDHSQPQKQGYTSEPPPKLYDFSNQSSSNTLADDLEANINQKKNQCRIE